MNFIKLRNFLFSLMAITMVTVFLSSCEQDELIDETLTISEEDRYLKLAEDANFIEYDKLVMQFMDLLNQAMSEKGVSGEDLKNSYLNDDLESINDLLEGTNANAIAAQMQSKVEVLFSDYKDIIDENKGIDIADIESGFNIIAETGSLELRKCRKRVKYLSCASAFLVSDVFCSAGSGGVGAAACTALAATGIATCSAKYC